MLKKTIRRLGALAMVLAMAVSVFAVNAFAADGETTEEASAKPSFTKKYSYTGATPAEDLEYKITSKSAVNNTVAADANLEIAVAKAAASDKFEITLPAYQGIGQFTYEMKENTGDTAGVTYNAANIKVIVTRTWKEANAGTNESNINTAVAIQDADGTAKLTEVTNTFEVGSLTVTKKLAGSFYSLEDEFTIQVKFTAPTGKVVRSSFKINDEVIDASKWENGTYTATIQLKGNESCTFTDLPVGVTYAVTETNKLGYEDSYDRAQNGTIVADTTNTTVTNTKNAPPVTGVIKTVAPYALMVVLAGAFAVVFLTRRNRAE